MATITDSIGFDNSYQLAKSYFESLATFEVKERIQVLKKLKNWVIEHEKLICDAIYADFKKPHHETYLTEIGSALSEIGHFIRYTQKWSQPIKVSTPLLLLPSRSTVLSQPKGVVLIIAPWNYPFYLAITPLIAAIAAGNVVILKPAHETSNTARVLAKMVSECITDDRCHVLLGEGKIMMDPILDQYRFDHIFFTGSQGVGKKIMAQAAKYLTPVTLELGGKSPVIIDKGFDLAFAARKIVWGKFINAGQTCVCPDYVMVHENDEQHLITALKSELNRVFGTEPKQSENLARVITTARTEKLISYLSEGAILHGGEYDLNEKYIAPTLIKPNAEANCMKEEIFGPILPIITYKDEKEIGDIVNRNPNPLSTYIFSTRPKFYNNFLTNLSFGNGAINNVVQQLGNANLPFGGIQQSGMGSYHGKYGFDAFSHQKGILHSSLFLDLAFKYHQYTTSKMKWIKRFFEWF